jgi:hypothetical protein
MLIEVMSVYKLFYGNTNFIYTHRNVFFKTNVCNLI